MRLKKSQLQKKLYYPGEEIEIIFGRIGFTPDSRKELDKKYTRFSKDKCK